jgi:hypothetical protein
MYASLKEDIVEMESKIDVLMETIFFTVIGGCSFNEYPKIGKKLHLFMVRFTVHTLATVFNYGLPPTV